MDILCVGMLRSCSTWQYDVVSHLVERHLGGTRLGYLEGPEYLQQPEATRDQWRIVKAHYQHPVFAERIASGTAVAIYSYRDIRDVVFSVAHKFSLKFDDLLNTGKFQALLNDDQFWRAQPGILIQSYEEIVSRPVTCVRELAALLNITLKPGEAGTIAREYSFGSNLNRTNTLARRLRAEGLDLSEVHNSVRHDPKTLLHWNHLRSGRVGAWREQATLEQRRILAEVFDPWLEANGYEIDDLPPVSAGEATIRKPVQAVRQTFESLTRRAGAGKSATDPTQPLLFDRMLALLPKRLGRWLSGLFTAS